MRFIAVLAFPAVAACAPALDAPAHARACVAETGDALPAFLAETGVDDVDCVRPYEPRAWLWSDGADKSRQIMLPDVSEDGAVALIDDRDVDHWRLPVGTKLWKTFSVDGKDIETRFLWQREPNLWEGAVYAWQDDGSAPRVDQLVTDDPDVAVENARGTGHDIPSSNACSQCHSETMEPIGFAAIQLGHDDASKGITNSALLDAGRFEHARTPAAIALPGDEVDQQVLGSLHASCGHCHRDGGQAEYLSMRIRLEVGKLANVAESPLFQTAVNQDAQTREGKRIAAGSPEESVMALYMAHRGAPRDDGVMQMPPLGTEVVDAETLSALQTWITRLPR